jgi:anaerobic selenocysteine-containing dehydrogenase
MDKLSRRSFMKVAGAATGAAALAAAPPLARAAMEPEAEQIDPTARLPHEPVVAYVRDAARGEITVLAGTREATYRDKTLVKRLLKAAGRQSKGVR